MIVSLEEKPKGWMTNQLMKDWLLVVWNRRSGAVLRKQGMLVMDVFKGHLTPEIEGTITGSSHEHRPCDHTWRSDNCRC